MKLRHLFVTLSTLLYTLPLVVFAATATPFVPLDNSIYNKSPIQNLYQNTQAGSFGGTLNGLMTIAISIGAFLAVIKLVQAGFLYQGGDAWDKKQQAKEILQNVILGLLLLFGVWLILYQINPCILDLSRIFQDFTGNGTAACAPTGI